MATVAEDRGIMPFLREALALLASGRLVVPAVVLTVLLTASNIVIAMNVPPEGAKPGVPFAVAALVRVVGLLVLAVGILRIMTGSARVPFRPDAGFWLYALSFVAATAVSIGVRLATGADDSVASIALVNAVVTILLAPLAVWFGALAVERPAAWRPTPWVRRLGLWLPYFLFWSLAVVTPLAVLHAAIDVHVLNGAGDGFWPLLLFDGPLSAVMALFGMALVAAAYRRVARG